MGEKLAIGVDGGGTKTLAWLAKVTSSGSTDVLGRGLSGSSNVRAVGWELATQNLYAAMVSAQQEAGLPDNQIDAAVLALAGAGQADMQRNIIEWAEQNKIAQQIDIIHDAQAVLEAGTPNSWGVALVAGTGSVAYAADSEGQTSTTGGWGYWFGDEGSGFWLGQAALRAVSQAVDGRGPQTLLAELVLNRLGITSPRAILENMASIGDVRSGIASLADLVVDAAEQNDATATNIIDEAATHLAQLVSCAANQIGLNNNLPLALAGGVLCNSNLIREKTLQQLEKLGIEPDTIQQVADPVAGCLQVAAKICSR